MGDRQYGIDPVRLAEYAAEIKNSRPRCEIIVIGGGNILGCRLGPVTGWIKCKEITWEQCSYRYQRYGIARHLKIKEC
jgi:hypothetical protein